jgi:hypothetical protein
MASTLRLVLPAFIAGKLVSLLAPMLTVWNQNGVPGHPTYAELLSPFGGWDGDAYKQLAQHGYPSGPLDLTPDDPGHHHPGHLWAFFPGYPMLMRAAMVFFPDATTAGVIVNSLGELVALIFLAKLALHELSGDTESARFSAWLLAVYPYAVFLTAVYTEGPFLAAAVASLYCMRRGQHLRAGILAAVATAIRITGLALIPALLLEYLLRRRWRPQADVLAVLLPVVALLLFLWYAHAMTGDTFAFWHAEQSGSYNRFTSWPWNGLQATWESARGGGRYSFVYAMELIFGVLGLVAVVYLVTRWREIAPSLIVHAASVWVLSVSYTSWLSVPRYLMAMVPLYLAVAVLTRGRPQLRTSILVASAGWMGFVSTLFGLGVFVS